MRSARSHGEASRAGRCWVIATDQNRIHKVQDFHLWIAVKSGGDCRHSILTVNCVCIVLYCIVLCHRFCTCFFSVCILQQFYGGGHGGTVTINAGMHAPKNSTAWLQHTLHTKTVVKPPPQLLKVFSFFVCLRWWSPVEVCISSAHRAALPGAAHHGWPLPAAPAPRPTVPLCCHPPLPAPSGRQTPPPGSGSGTAGRRPVESIHVPCKMSRRKNRQPAK